MEHTAIKKPELLLHICCAACGAFVASSLKAEYDVILYYYNPNIFPQSEYDFRLSEVQRVAAVLGLRLIASEYEHKAWLKKIAGLEKEPERGARCHICYRLRLESAAQIARKENYQYFTSTLTVSPHKDAAVISTVGRSLAKKYAINFLDKDFKKQDGFKKSLQMSKDLNLYRQNYCGCEFSKI